MTNKNVACSLLLSLATIVLLNSAQTYAEKQEPYETVTKFCSQKNNTKDTKFCTRVLKSDPRSATADNNTALLLISGDLAIGKLSKTRDYLVNSQKSNLKECADAYKSGIGQLQIMPKELKSGPEYASYDAQLATDAMLQCKQSLEKNRISDPFVLKMYGIDQAFVQLCLDIAMTVR